MAVDETLHMDHEAVRAMANDVSDLAISFESVERYARGDGMKVEHLGGSQKAPGAFNAFNGAVDRLATSVRKGQGFLSEAARRLTDSADDTEASDVNGAWGITEAGEAK